MRHHFTNAGTCHAWAHQESDWGQSSGGRVQFQGVRLYSYGRHYMIAALLPGGLALFNAESNSPSTNGHRSNAQSAARHMTRFNIPDPADLFDIFERTGIIDRLQAEADGKRPGPWTGLPVWRAEGETPSTAARRAVRRYVVKHAAALDGNRESMPHRGKWEEAPAEARLVAVWILGLVGLGESTWRKISEADTRQRAKAKAEAKRTALANLVMSAKFAADRSESSFLEALARNALLPVPCSAWDVADRVRIIKETATKWRGLHKAAKRHLSAKRTRTIWGRIKVMAAEALRLEAIENRVGLRRNVRAAVSALRNRGQVPMGATLATWGEVLAAAEGQAGHVLAHNNRGLVFALARALEALSSAYGAEGLGGGIKVRAAESLAALAPYQESIAQVESAKAAAAAIVRRRAEVERQAETRRAWLAGEPGARFYGRDEHGAAYLRAVDVAQDESGEITGGRLQTSQGAEVPLVEAFRAFRFLKLCREAGQAWESNGQNLRVGHFRIESVSACGDFRVACHFIRWEEVSRLAESLGVLGYAADDSAVAGREAA